MRFHDHSRALRRDVVSTLGRNFNCCTALRKNLVSAPSHLLRSTLTGAGVLLKFLILHSDCINNNGSFKTEPEDKNSSVIYLVVT